MFTYPRHGLFDIKDFSRGRNFLVSLWQKSLVLVTPSFHMGWKFQNGKSSVDLSKKESVLTRKIPQQMVTLYSSDKLGVLEVGNQFWISTARSIQGRVTGVTFVRQLLSKFTEKKLV